MVSGLVVLAHKVSEVKKYQKTKIYKIKNLKILIIYDIISLYLWHLTNWHSDTLETGTESHISS